MTAGQALPPEWHSLRDERTGREVVQLTDSDAEDYHLYFYNPSVTPDGRYLVFFSERTGISNLFRLDLQLGDIVQLTDAVPARAEYWPFTGPIQGAGACLACLGSGGREVFYFVGVELWATEIETARARRLLTLPDDRRPSILHADRNGSTLVFATWDEALFAEWSRRAFAGEQFPDDRFFQTTASTICRVEAASGRCEEALRRERFWINHVLIHPDDPDRIEFCHEYTGQPDRMWLLNASTRGCAPIPGQGQAEWYQHEFWSADGRRVCFHGGRQDDESHGFCGWCSPDGQDYEKFEHVTPGRAYAHYNLHPDGVSMVTDGEARPGCISRVRLAAGRQTYEVLCRHDSYQFGDDQRCHPHPSFTPDGRQVIFTSNRSGTSNVYRVAWDE